MISSGCKSNAPQAPSPPALATAIDTERGQAPAIGARRIGTRSPKRLQNDSARALTSLTESSCICARKASSLHRIARVLRYTLLNHDPRLFLGTPYLCIGPHP